MATGRERLGLLLLHALPLDGSMWTGQMDILPRSTCAPTLYGLGDTIEEWAAAALKLVSNDRLIVVGCSVGGSCALEVAAIAPDRVAALVLIGTKARHRPDPELHAAALETIRNGGLEKAWETYWGLLLSGSASNQVKSHAKGIALRQSPQDIAKGVTVFHTRPSHDEVLSGFSDPMVLITGADDSAPGPKTTAAQAASTPHGQLHVIPECDHYVPLERPEYLNAILQDLVLRLGGAF
ncbi:alpha/beta fold hydrolase [Neorhizobium sp. LjRoot104]|uniref:alpha/beta fold hydrolase n=1 Tax=Neorhizobium sp. LjRoot104 TaxID=3342254 RepID=UPI003ED0FED7